MSCFLFNGNIMGIHSVFLWFNIHHSPEMTVRHSNTHICDVRWETQILIVLCHFWRHGSRSPLWSSHDGKSNQKIISEQCPLCMKETTICLIPRCRSMDSPTTNMAHGRPRQQQHSASEVFASQSPSQRWWSWTILVSNSYVYIYI
jgi:hypothetical protein